jgi:hypothetical protein
MKRVLAVAISAFALFAGCATAHADIGGSVVGPGGCDYPAVGYFGSTLGAVWYICATPVEENGSHHACLYGGWSLGTAANALASSGGAIIGIIANIGGQGGSCLFRWPDNSEAPAPNPPGSWKTYLVPKPAPLEHRSPHREPYMSDQAALGQVAPDVPEPPAPQPDSPGTGYQFQTPANNTNPVLPNPEGEEPRH